MKGGFTIKDLERLKSEGKIRGYTSKNVKPVPKKNKYGNEKIEVGGRWFDSKKEAKYYGQLCIRLKVGEIGLVECQKPYRIEVDGKLVCKYIADFVYFDHMLGTTVVVDVKSSFTRKLPVYRLKKKLMKEVLGIEIVEA